MPKRRLIKVRRLREEEATAFWHLENFIERDRFEFDFTLPTAKNRDPGLILDTNTHTHKHTHTHIHTHTRTHAHTHAHTRAHTHTHTRLHLGPVRVRFYSSNCKMS